MSAEQIAQAIEAQAAKLNDSGASFGARSSFAHAARIAREIGNNGTATQTTHVAHVPTWLIPTDTPVVDVKVEHWEDGTVEVAFRPGIGQTWTTWGAPVEAVRS